MSKQDQGHIAGIIGFIILLIIIWAVNAHGSATTYVVQVTYGETGSDSATWLLYAGADSVGAGKMSEWDGRDSGVYVDTITIGAKPSLLFVYRVWEGLSYDIGCYFLNQRANVIAIANDSTNAERIIDSLHAILDSLQSQDNWVATATVLDNVRDTVNALADTTQLWDDEIAKINNLIDSLYAVLDTLQNQDNWAATLANQTLIKDTLQAIVDTLQNQDNWIAGSTILGNVRDTANAIMDSLQLWDDNFVYLDAAISSRGTSNLTASDNIGVNFSDISGTLDASEIGTGAIGADQVAAGAITSSEAPNLDVAVSTRGTSNLVASDNIGINAGDVTGTFDSAAFADSYKHMIALHSDSGATGSSVWSTAQRDSVLTALTNAAIAAKVWSAASKTLTSLGFDLDSTMFANKTFPTWLFTTEFFDSAQGSASGLTAQDVWNIAFNTAFSSGSMGDSLNNASYVQGTASGLTAMDFWNVAFGSAFTAGSMGDSLNDSNYVRARIAALALQSEVANLDGWNPITDNDSLIVDMSSLANRPKIGDTSSAGDDIFAEVQNLNGSSLANLDAAVSTRGTSNFNAASESVIVDVSAAITAGGLVSKTEDSVYAGRNDYKADVSALALQTEVANLNGWNPATDSVNVDVSAATMAGGLISKAEDSIYANRDGYKADVSALALQTEVANLNGWNPTSDLIFRMDSVIAALSHAAMREKIWSASTRSLTALDSLILAESFKHLIALRSDSGSSGSSVWTSDEKDSVLARTLKALDSIFVVLDTLQSQDGWVAKQAEVENLNGWNPSSDSALPDMSILNAGLDKTGYSLSAPGVDALWDEDTTGHNTAKSFGKMLKDTSAYQGSASGLSIVDIKQGVWSDTAANYITAGTFGYNLDGQVSEAGCSGTGGNTVLTYAIDTSGTDDTLTGISLEWENSSGSTLAGPHATDATGSWTFYVPDGSLKLKGAWDTQLYTFPESTLTISANDTVALLGYNEYVAQPVDPTKTKVHATLVDRIGVDEDSVIVEIKRGHENMASSITGNLISGAPLYDTTVNGYFEFDLIQTHQYSDTTKGWAKIVGRYGRGANQITLFSIDSLYVPDTGSVDLSQVIQ